MAGWSSFFLWAAESTRDWPVPQNLRIETAEARTWVFDERGSGFQPEFQSFGGGGLPIRLPIGHNFG